MLFEWSTCLLHLLSLTSLYCSLHTRARWKVLDLAYNWCKTHNKWPLGSDPDRNWYYRHTSVKLFLVTVHDFMDIGSSIRVSAIQSMEPWAATKKALHYCGSDPRSCLSSSVPNGRLSRFSCQLSASPRTFHLARMLPPMSMEPWIAIKKALRIYYLPT